ncbi:MAG: YncE family protein [Terriglobales bacterium]
MRRTLSGLVVLPIFCCLTPALGQQVIDTIAVGNHPIYLAVDQNTNRVYVSNQADDTVSVIDGTTDTVVSTIRVGHNPNGVAANPRTNTIYVANLSSGTLSIINGASLTSSALRLGSSPAKVAVNPSTNRVYVTLEDEPGFLEVVGGKERRLRASVTLPPFPLSVAVDINAKQVYVADFLCGCGQISVVDDVTHLVVKTIDLPGASLVEGVAVDETRQRAYATDEKNGFYVIDTASGELLGKVKDLNYPNEVAVIPGTTIAVAPDTASNRAVFIDGAILAVKKRVTVGKFPTGVAVNALTKRAYVANRDSNTVSVIRLPDDWW